MTWNPITEPVDHAIVAGQRTPGIAEIVGASSPRRWDERRGYGLSGATVVFRGVGLARPTLRIKLLTEEHWEAWDAFAPLLQRPPLGERARALDIWHPHLEALGIRSVVIEDVLQPAQTGDGEWTVDVKLLEFRRPEFQLSRPEGSQEQPTDPVDLYIEQLAGQVQELAR